MSKSESAQVKYSAAYSTGRERIDDFSSNLFWDADPADLDFSKHKKYVVQRVLERGTLADMRHMFSMYGFDDVVATSKTLRSLDPMSFSFIVNLSGQPKEAFRCYTLKQSSQAPWIDDSRKVRSTLHEIKCGGRSDARDVGR